MHVCSLLKVHLQLRGLTVFLDIEKLRAGKFHDNLLRSIRNARHFILVLTPNSLDRCVGDIDRKDCVHRVRLKPMVALSLMGASYDALNIVRFFSGTPCMINTMIVVAEQR